MPSSRLPVDPDSTAGDRRRGVTAGALLLVALGGTAGTALREAAALLLPAPAGFPLPVLVVNILGAFLLGVLLERLALAGPDTGRRRDTRLLIGTGLLGGFTTYSAFAVGILTLLDGRPLLGLLYALGSVVLGALAAWAGIVAASSRRVTT